MKKQDNILDPAALLRTLGGVAPAPAAPLPSPTPGVARPVAVPAGPPYFGEPVVVAPAPFDRASAMALASESFASEEFRLLLAKIRILAEERPAQCLGIASALSGEGKTTMAMGLASAMSREPGRQVLLIEADLRKPAVDKYLGLPRQRGVGEWLEGSDDPLPLRCISPPGFWFLSGGLTKFERPELLGSARMAQLLEGARRRFNFVVVDCPPVNPVADSVLMQDLLDGFLFVVRAGLSPREAILRAVSRLRPGRIQGVVFNGQKEILSRYYGYGYGSYGAYR